MQDSKTTRRIAPKMQIQKILIMQYDTIILLKVTFEIITTIEINYFFHFKLNIINMTFLWKQLR